ncbi:MAG: PrpF domain-containing protein [Pseudomonadota bacterium]|jgi:2-methylaconitate cis-trans-isomerase PrpF|nr:PrpF domain-containing protein [Pseudomonadota bacterium]
MSQKRVPAIFMRGGSSKGVFFHSSDLPEDKTKWNEIFLSVLGSPDPYGRQLNGMGGGISSLSKAVVIGPPTRPDADVDYTFAQVSVRDALVDYSSNCGNLSSAVGPFAIDTGLVDASATEREVRIHNTNSRKLIVSRVPIRAGLSEVVGDFSIPGVSGTGAKIQLDFLDPGGTRTGRLLPTGNTIDTITLPHAGDFEVSLVDASVPCAFIEAKALGVTGSETVEELEANGKLMNLVEELRLAAGVKMGLGETIDQIPPTAPKLGIVATPLAYKTLAGEEVDPSSASLMTRIWSMGQVHRVLPLTGAMCLAVACKIPGTICERNTKREGIGVKLANPSGVLPLNAAVEIQDQKIMAKHVTAYRTARTLMEGNILVPE